MKFFLYRLAVAILSVLAIQGLAQASDDDVLVNIRPKVVWAGMALGSTNPTAKVSCQALSGYVSAAAMESIYTKTDATSGEFSMPQLNTRLIPGTTYSIFMMVDNGKVPPTTGSPGWVSAGVEVIAPAGYAVEINDKPYTMGYIVVNSLIQAPSGYITVKLVQMVNPGEGTAGMADSLSSDRVMWSLPLGVLQNGQSAGSISISNKRGQSTLASMFALENVDVAIASSDSAKVYLPGGSVIKQVVGPQVALDFVRVAGANAYDINVYHRSQFTNDAATTSPYYYTVTGSPLITYTVTPPAAGGTKAEIKYTIGARTMVTSLERTGTSPDFVWTAIPWTESGKPTQSKTVRTLSSGGFTEVVDVYDVPTSNRILTKTKIKRGTTANDTEKLLADEVSSEQNGGATFTYAYYETPTLATFGKVKSVSSSDGSWSGFEYASNGSIAVTHLPFQDSNLPADFATHTTGVKSTTTMTPDLTGQLSRPFWMQTTTLGLECSKTTYTYTTPNQYSPAAADYPFQAEGAGFWVKQIGLVTQTATTYSSSASALTTKKRFFGENVGSVQHVDNYAGNDFWRGLPYSVVNPDGTQISYVWQRGNWDGTAFAESGAGGASEFSGTNTNPYAPGLVRNKASRNCVITGLSTNVAGSTVMVKWSTFDIEDIYLVAGRSTMQMIIKDAYARVVRTENYIWNGTSFDSVAYKTFKYTLSSQLDTWEDGVGNKYKASYDGERLISETGPDGILVSYTYDAMGRTETVTRAGNTGGGLVAIASQTTYSADAGGSIITETTSSNLANPSVESLKITRKYDTNGRLVSETKPNTGTSTIAYDTASRKVTTTNSDAATRIEITYKDGQMKSVSGTGVVAEGYSYGVDPGGWKWSEINLGGSALRKVKTWIDWMGREIQSTVPAFENSSLITSTQIYNALGRLEKSTRTDVKDTIYVYDEFSQLKRKGVDMDGNGSLVPASTDRIVDLEVKYEKFGSDWWATNRSYNYPYDGGSNTTRVQTSYSRERVSGLSQAKISEVETTDIEGNKSLVIRAFDASVSKTTATTTTDGIVGSKVEVSYQGFTKSITYADSNVTSYTYDALRRVATISEPANALVTLGYYNGTTLVQTSTKKGSASQDLINTTWYDSLGRPNAAQDPQSRVVYTSYTSRGEVYRQWGSGTYPVEYQYDVFGQRWKMKTYRTVSPGTWNTNTWPATVPAASDGSAAGDLTEWVMDPSTGLLSSKKDAASQSVSFRYNTRGQVTKRTSSRSLVTDYTYDPVTGDLTDTVYTGATDSFGVALAPTNLNYQYDRTGRVKQVTDALGTRTLNFDSAKPWRVTSETLPAFYGSRTLSYLYESATGAGTGTYGGQNPYTLLGRGYGFELKNGSTLEQHTHYVTSDNGRLIGANVGVTAEAVYKYRADGLIDRSDFGSLGVERGYDAYRPAMTLLKSSWSTTVVSQFDYVYNSVGQRRFMGMSGSAFSDYGGSVYRAYRYNNRGELARSAAYNGAMPSLADLTSTDSDTATNSNELPGRRYEFNYDEIGNRFTGGTSNTSGGGEYDSYATNNLNQYTGRDNTFIRLTGTVGAGAKAAVKVAGSANATMGLQASQSGRAFGAVVKFADGHQEVNGNAEFFGTLVGTGGAADKFQKVTKQFPLAKDWQQFTYDLDGNMTGDGLRNYSYDHENRLIRIAVNAAGLLAGLPNQQSTFVYDYLGRRCKKTVTTGGTSDISLFVYSGWNPVAELSSSGSLYRVFHWGLDLTGSLTASGGVGALLQMKEIGTGKVYLPTYDANGNTATLLDQSNGSLVAAYEYGTFGEALRADGAYAKKNPFRFSTKWHDDESGLIYYGQRYYSAELGRFINRDPIAEAGGLNLYGFCGNDGVGRWDYLGYSWLSKAVKKVGKWISRNWTSIVSAVLSVICPPLALAFNMAIGYIYGGIKGMLLGLATSAITQFIGGVLGGALKGFGGASAWLGAIAKGAVMGTISGGVAAGLSGGNIGEGMLAGAIAGGVTAGISYGVGLAVKGTAIERAGNKLAQEMRNIGTSFRQRVMGVMDQIVGKRSLTSEIVIAPFEVMDDPEGRTEREADQTTSGTINLSARSEARNKNAGRDSLTISNQKAGFRGRNYDMDRIMSVPNPSKSGAVVQEITVEIGMRKADGSIDFRSSKTFWEAFPLEIDGKKIVWTNGNVDTFGGGPMSARDVFIVRGEAYFVPGADISAFTVDSPIMGGSGYAPQTEVQPSWWSPPIDAVKVDARFEMLRDGTTQAEIK